MLIGVIHTIKSKDGKFDALMKPNLLMTMEWRWNAKICRHSEKGSRNFPFRVSFSQSDLERGKNCKQ